MLARTWRCASSLAEIAPLQTKRKINWAPKSWPVSAFVSIALDSRRFIRIAGQDAGQFLQGLISNDIRSNDSIYTGFFTHKGRYLFDAFIMHDSQDKSYLLDIDESALDTALSHIKRYRLRSQIEITDISEDVNVESFLSPDPNVLARIVRDLKYDLKGNRAFFDPRAPGLGLRLLSRKGSSSLEMLKLFSSTSEGDYFYDAWLMLNGVPRHGQELVSEKTIPLEANL
jgi:transferase CAF17, mitochondrial